MLQFGILGPLGAWVEDQEIELGAAKQRALLAVLLLHAGETVSTDHLVEALWGKQPPQTAPEGDPGLRLTAPQETRGRACSRPRRPDTY